MRRQIPAKQFRGVPHRFIAIIAKRKQGVDRHIGILGYGGPNVGFGVPAKRFGKLP
jgi:hypothetical protein